MTARRVAIVTGSSSGIGRSCAIKLSKDGWAVVLSARREAELKQTAELCSGKTLVVAGDVSKEEDVVRLFDETVKTFGRLDMLFNNAGIGGPRLKLDEIPLDGFLSTLDINVKAPFLCSREAFKIFLRQEPQGGRIINNGSISAHTPRPFSAPYCISKHAITGLTKSIALDGRPFNITATQVDIGNAATELSFHTSKGTLQADGSVKAEAQMNASYVADAVAHVANLPNEVTMLEMTILATGMPYVGRG